MKFHQRFTGLILIGLCLSSSHIRPLLAESPPVPAPTPGVKPPQNYATATITFPRSESVTARGLNGRFETVGIHFHEVADINFQFPDNPATTVLHAQALDGGIIIGNHSVGSFKFHAPGKPGLYRILLSSSAGAFTLPFWITDSSNPGNKRPVINPTH